MKWLVYILALSNLLVLLFVYQLPEPEESSVPPAPNLPRVETLTFVDEPDRDSDSQLVSGVPSTAPCYILSGFSSPRAARDWARLRNYPVGEGDITQLRASDVLQFRLVADYDTVSEATERAVSLRAQGVSAQLVSDGGRHRLQFAADTDYRALLDGHTQDAGESQVLEYAAQDARFYGLIGGARLHELARKQSASPSGVKLRLVSCESVANAGENP